MKIIKTKERIEYLKTGRMKANEGCNVCPCCGKENRVPSRYRGANSKMQNFLRNVFGIKIPYRRKDIYDCLYCRAEWESEPYEWEDGLYY